MRFARPLVTVTTMASVAAMAFVTSVPANALLDPHPLEPGLASGATDPVAASGQSQNLVQSEAAAATIARDGYTWTAPPPPPPPPPVVVPDSPSGPVRMASGGGAVRWPFDGPIRVSDDFGPRASPCAGCSSMHPGTDYLPGNRNPVYAVAEGVVRKAVDSDVGLGVYVVLEHVIDGQMVTTTYAHMDFGSLQVSEGQTVAAGQMIGRVGNSGASTGPHLHFEVRPGGGDPVDSEVWLAARAG